MGREEKQLEASLDALLSQAADLKNSLGSFIYKLENEYDRLTWPSVLDSFALLSGQLNTLNKVLKHEKTPLFRNQVIIPLVLSPDRDEDLMRQTEGRVPVFSHEVVPDHLRTKPDPEVEEQEKQLTTDAARIGADAAQKQIQSLNKMCSNLLEKISKEERESESGGLRQNKQTFNPADTNALVAAVAFGKGLSNWRPSGSSGPGQSGQPGAGTILAGASGLQPVQMAGTSSQQQPMLSGVQMAQASQPGKMPSGIKTNIKSASMHPYQRNWQPFYLLEAHYRTFLPRFHPGHPSKLQMVRLLGWDNLSTCSSGDAWACSTVYPLKSQFTSYLGHSHSVLHPLPYPVHMKEDVKGPEDGGFIRKCLY
ncbi:mediator of RNA polymerase II transcription subunit 8 isoform X3 [Choloepus didactylus]|uniref:mediator of RNA polymerase II transcription subunit 8 isoform X3 n=1 Tax=Choloepus didactylus TaxID=27675 RepID=UPI0018A11769|nr:mediator of RNA polymerase II transcription subunit 8 isoform X3 [Choloepus didactylus]